MQTGYLNLAPLIVKVASHLSSAHVANGTITQSDFEGDSLADHLAGKAAASKSD